MGVFIGITLLLLLSISLLKGISDAGAEAIEFVKNEDKSPAL